MAKDHRACTDGQVKKIGHLQMAKYGNWSLQSVELGWVLD